MYPFHSPESSVQKYTHSTLAHRASQLQSEETKKKTEALAASCKPPFLTELHLQ